MSSEARIAELEQDVRDLKKLNADLYQALQERVREVHTLQRELSNSKDQTTRSYAAWQEKTRQYDALLSVVNIAPHLATENVQLNDKVQELMVERDKYYAALSGIYDVFGEKLGWRD